MTTKVNETKKSVIKFQRELNNVLKEEHSSFTSLIKILKSLKGSQAMKDYLNAANLTMEQITDLNYFRSALVFHSFDGLNGSYEHIARKDRKTGELVKAKWSFWLILSAARKVRKEEIKREQIVQRNAKEASLKAMEKESNEVQR